MSQLYEESKKSDFGAIGVLIKWLLIGGPQRKPGKPQKTPVFRLLWFITVVSLFVALLSFPEGNGGDMETFCYASAVFVFAIFMWIVRAVKSKKTKAPDQESVSSDNREE